MDKRLSVTIVMIVVLAASILLFVIQSQPITDIPDDVRHKLTDSMIEMLSSTPADELIDSIVVCSGPNYLSRAQDAIGNFTVLHDWDSFRMFRAMLLPSQIIELARQSFVSLIDFNSEEAVIPV